uniref:Zinc transporter ZIP6 n=1 Tax=Latimeria chalumnae TaxID=7897 RepID=H3AEY6_LATCH
VNTHAATLMQTHHLQALFHRYGENDTLTVEGLAKLLQKIGVHKMKKVKVKHEHFHHDHSAGDHRENHNFCQDPKPEVISNTPQDDQLKSTGKVHQPEKDYVPKNASHEITTASLYISSSRSTENDASFNSSPNSKAPFVINVELTTRSTLDGAENTSSNLQADGDRNESLHVLDDLEKGTYMSYSQHRAHHKHVSREKEGRSRKGREDEGNKLGPEPSSPLSFKRREKEYIWDCLNASTLLTSHGLTPQMMLTHVEFSYLCPALLNQIDSNSCIIHASGQKKTEGSVIVQSAKTAWFGGFLSISVISFISLMGITLIPLMNRAFFKFLLCFLVALAVGTLGGDAFLHLIPHHFFKTVCHACGAHRHRHEAIATGEHNHVQDVHSSSQNSEPDEYLNSVYKGLTALGGLYFMFLVEHLIILIKMFKDKKQKNQKQLDNADEDVDASKQLSGREGQQFSDEQPPDTKAHADQESPTASDSREQSQLHTQQPATPEEEVMIAHQESYSEYTATECENKCHSHFHDTLGQSDEHMHHHHDYHHILHHHHHQNHHPHSHTHHYSHERLKDAGIATLAWMVIMEDGLHNFSDGLAIENKGAAFTEGLSSGLSTSVAILCHEIPHEIGDFAVLLKAGMTVKQAIFCNLFSAVLAYLGMVTGIVIGHYAEDVSEWIFAATAGLFLYVALVDMVPQLLHNDANDHGFSHWFFILQNVGMLLGFGIMLLIALFEHKILLSLNV